MSTERFERAIASGNYSPAVVAKARRLYAAGKVRQDPDYPDVFWVGSGSESGREYRTQLYEHFASCSCKHGIHTGSDAHCAHPLAAMEYAAENGLPIPGGDSGAEQGAANFEAQQDGGYRPYRGLGPDDLPEEPF